MTVQWTCIQMIRCVHQWRWRLLLLPFLIPLFTGTLYAQTNTNSFQPINNSLLSIYLLALDNDLASQEQTLVTNIQAGTAGKYDRMALVVIDGAGPHDTQMQLIRNGDVSVFDGLPDALGVIRDNLHEYDMADGPTLGGLLQWARQSYPATQTLVTFVGHGLPAAPVADVDQLWPREVSAAGRSGGNHNILLPTKYWAYPNYTDNHPKRTMLTPKQLGIALAMATAGGADPITVLDLIHCFSATIEELVEVAPYVLATIGSPGYTYLQPAMLQRSQQELPTNLGALALAKRLATYHQIDEPNHPQIITVVDNRRLAALHDAWNQIAGTLYRGLQQEPTTRTQLLTAWQQAGKYDAPLCDEEWRIDEHDYLVDLGSFAQALKRTFANDAMNANVDQLFAVLAEAVTTWRHADHPWMRPEQYWHYDGTYAGVALYGNLSPLMQDGQAYLSFQGHFYTSAGAEAPYRFLQPRRANDTTWADVFTTFWQGQSLQTLACLPSLYVDGGGDDDDLALQISLTPTAVAAMEDLTYTLAVQNRGAEPVTDVTLYPTLPDEVELLTLDSRCQVVEWVITCPLGVVDPHATLILTLTYRPVMAGPLLLSAELTSRAPAGHFANQQVNAVVMVQPATNGCLLQAWQQQTIYWEGDQVCHKGHHWQARWWSYGDEPGQAEVWVDLGPCSGQATVASAENPDAGALSPDALPMQLFLPLALR